MGILFALKSFRFGVIRLVGSHCTGSNFGKNENVLFVLLDRVEVLEFHCLVRVQNENSLIGVHAKVFGPGSLDHRVSCYNNSVFYFSH